MTSYPTTVWSPTSKTDGVDWPQASHINDLQNEVVAIQSALKANFATSPATGQLLMYDGTKWAPIATPTNTGDLLTWNGSTWVAQDPTPRVGSTTSSATPSINCDIYDAYSITSLAAAITSVTVTGTPSNFQKLIIRIKDNGTARAITWGASFEAKGMSLPTTTVISKVLTVGFIYDSVTSKWGCVAVAQEV